MRWGLPGPALVCVPDFSHVPGEGCAGRFGPEVAWLRECHAGGATMPRSAPAPC